MDKPTAAGDALAHPTRARLFAELERLRRPASTRELADALGLHVNGVRRQLERLRADGLVTRTTVRRERGRPRDEWAIASDAAPGGRAPRSYADLASWLARTIPPTGARLREIERTGREVGLELAPDGGDASPEAFRATLAALGFRPRLSVNEQGHARCELCNCPYRESARVNQQVVCTLHRGLTAGLVERMAPGARLAAFEPRDPDRAGCVIELTGTDWTPAATAHAS